jgi:crotonobetaine/carnitine-CoA ligase
VKVRPPSALRPSAEMKAMSALICAAIVGDSRDYLTFMQPGMIPINIHYKESWLVHEVDDCEARLAIVHEQYLERFIQVADQLEHLTDFVVVGGDDSTTHQEMDKKWSMHAWGDLENAEAIDEPVETHYYDTAAIMYTSGTTGPSTAPGRASPIPRA